MRLVFVFALMVMVSSAFAGPFATSVVQYLPGPSQWDGMSPVPYHDAQLALGRPYGLGKNVPDNSSVVTLGDGGKIVLEFDQPVFDDPDNPYGLDFIVFSNATFIGGDRNRRWQELAFVEISANGIDWFMLPPSKPLSQLVGPHGVVDEYNQDTGHSRTVVRNYAEYTPTLALPVTRTPEEFFCIPDRQSMTGSAALLDIDAVSGGGDAFDIVQTGLTQFQWIRITDALVGDFEDEVNEVSAEIDAVSDVRPAETIGKAKARSNGEFTVIKDALVTGVFPTGSTKPSEVYVQEEDRSAVIRLVNTAAVSLKVGDTVIATGHLATSGSERTITDPLVTVLSSGTDVKPLGMTCAAAISSPARLVRVCGEVKENLIDSFTIDDGSGPVNVWCGTLVQPNRGDHAAVTGVVGPANNQMSIKARIQSDITSY